MESLPPMLGVYEMTLEVKDLAAAERFYAGLLGLEVIDRWPEPRPAIWLRLGGGAFLGLWSQEAGGEQAIFRGRGGAHVHFALRVPHGSLVSYAERIAAEGLEHEWRRWDSGNVALYFNDPDGNVVELTELVVQWDGTRDATANTDDN